MSLDVSRWLQWQRRSPSGYAKFDVTDTIEHVAPDDALLELIGQRIVGERLDRGFLEEAARVLGWGAVDELVRDILPTQDTIRKGVFGEVIATEVLESFQGYVIPIAKFRYAITRNQSLPGTDILALRLEGESIAEAAFVESKLRTTRDSGTAVHAHRQLRADYAKRMPDILIFTAQRLHETGDHLALPFMQYLGDRRDAAMDSFHVFMVHDRSSWSDDGLANLEEDEPHLAPLSANVVLIDHLNDVLERCYGLVGLRPGVDDD